MEIRHPITEIVTRKCRELAEACRSGELVFSIPNMENSVKRILREDTDSLSADDIRLIHTAHYLHFSSKYRDTTLTRIQKEYFSILREHFWEHYLTMHKRNLNEQDYTVAKLQDAKYQEKFTAELVELGGQILRFWDEYGAATKFLLSEQKLLQCAFGGDIFPSYTHNLASQVCGYADTLVLPDPLLRIVNFFRGNTPPHHELYYAMKHGINALKYEPLATTEKCAPIVCIAPDLIHYDMASEEFIERNASSDTAYHFRIAFGRDFCDFQELMSFAEKLNSIEDILSAAKVPQKLILNTDNANLPIARQLYELISDSLSKMPALADVSPTPGTIVVHSVFGRMVQTNEMLFKSALYNGTPLSDAPTSSHFLQQKLEYDAERVSGALPRLRDSSIIQSLLNEETVSTLQQLPNEALIELREKGMLTSLRELLLNGVHELDTVKPEAFARVAKKVSENLNCAMQQYNSDLDEIRSTKKEMSLSDVPRFLVVGGLSVAAVLSGNAVLPAIAGVAALLGFPAIPELVKKGKSISTKSKRLKYSPISILKKQYF
jgi:hypothetical protein